jgi:membrane protease YdiL (CAAX protease family)
VAIAVAGILLVPLLGLVIPNVWLRIAAAGTVLTVAALALVPLPWRSLWRPRMEHLAWGVVAAGVLYGIGLVAAAALARVPAGAAQIAAVYAWRDAAPSGLLLPLLLAIICYEEVVWRNAVTLPLVARLGPVRGVLAAAAAFAASHLSLGVPLLVLAALGAGAFWSALVVRTRSAVPALVSHVLWDIAILLLWPYAGA